MVPRYAGVPGGPLPHAAIPVLVHTLSVVFCSPFSSARGRMGFLSQMGVGGDYLQRAHDS
ncbi:hypothetical protein LZ30DRAFT_705280 [Colletotrichum cereale]|nr:hypothetical protein LZ30DRAFT_705280 [Colletotrichum cereale]